MDHNPNEASHHASPPSAHSLVADAVAEELREVLAALDLDAGVTVRQDTDPVLVSSGASTGVDDLLGLRKWGPTVVVALPLGDGAVLAQVVRGRFEGQRHG